MNIQGYSPVHFLILCAGVVGMAKCLVEKLQIARNYQSVKAREGFPCQLDFDLNFKFIFRAIFQSIILYRAPVWKCHISKTTNSSK